MKIKDNDIYVYDESVGINEILPLIIKKNRCKKFVPSLNISWTAIQNQMKTRSVDDIRNQWELKIKPLLVPQKQKEDWSVEDDLQLLELVVDQDMDEVDFDDIADENNRTEEENRRRWNILLKGLGGQAPGKIFKPKQIALKMIEDIKTRNERYVPWTSKRSTNRNGSNKFIDILKFYREHYA